MFMNTAIWITAIYAKHENFSAKSEKLNTKSSLLEQNNKALKSCKDEAF